MDRDELLKETKTEDIVKLMKELGSQEPIPDKDGNLYFQTICHCGKKHKLLYYTESKMFMCYTNCGTMSIYDLISQVNGYEEFRESFSYLAKFLGVSTKERKSKGLKIKTDNSEIEILNKHLYKSKDTVKQLPSFDENILKMFDRIYPIEWEEEGIKEEIADYFGIRFYIGQFKCIIPHRDIDGRLVGVRGRNFLKRELDKGKKYIPVTIQGLTYRYPIGMNLYGLYENKSNIKKSKKAILFESEKSILKYGSMYGQENNIALATMSMNLTKQQRNILIELGVDEVILAWDKQYKIEFLNEENKNSKEYKEFEMYIRKVKKAISMLLQYVNVSVIFCWDERLDYKDAPIDKGKYVFEELLDERYLVEDIEELEELL